MGDYNLSDIRAATEGSRDYDGFGGGNWLWIIVLFIFMFGMGGNGWGGRGSALTQAEMQMGFDTQEITRKLDGLANGLCDGFYAQNTTMLTGFNTLGMQVAENRFAAQQCCCETNRNIDAVRYEGQKNTCDITTAIHAEGEATRALLTAQENQRIRDELDQARGIISNFNQSRYILGQLGNYYTNPPCYGYGRCGGCEGECWG